VKNTATTGPSRAGWSATALIFSRNGAQRLRFGRGQSHYWRPVPIHRIKVLPTKDPTPVCNLFLLEQDRSHSHTRRHPPPSWCKISGRTLFSHQSVRATSFMRFNVNANPFDDVRVRKAWPWPWTEGIITKITRAGEARPTRWFRRQSRLHPAAGPAYNLGGSAPLAAEAGYPDGRGFPRSACSTKRGVGDRLPQKCRRCGGVTWAPHRFHCADRNGSLSQHPAVDRFRSLSLAWIGPPPN